MFQSLARHVGGFFHTWDHRTTGAIAGGLLMVRLHEIQAVVGIVAGGLAIAGSTIRLIDQLAARRRPKPPAGGGA